MTMDSLKKRLIASAGEAEKLPRWVLLVDDAMTAGRIPTSSELEKTRLTSNRSVRKEEVPRSR